VIARGDRFTVFVNGRRVTAFTDTALGSGEISLGVGTYTGSGASWCDFADVKIWNISRVGASATPRVLFPTRRPAASATPQPPTRTPAAGSVMAVVTVASANLRSGPGEGFTVVGTARRGESFPAVAQHSGWFLIRRNGGALVWISSTVSDLSPAGSVLPAPATVPAGGSTTGGAGGSGGTGSTSDRPRIISARLIGACSSYTYEVVWEDPNGDAMWLVGVNFNPRHTEPISGRGATTRVGPYRCNGTGCFGEFYVLDRANNRSSTVRSNACQP
jgi:hypothetical protein